jgi:hypothetical protein
MKKGVLGKLAILFVFLLEVVSINFAQISEPKHSVLPSETCGSTNSFLGDLRDYAVAKKERIFVVSHLGKNEKSKYSKIRIRQAKNAFIILSVDANLALFTVGEQNLDVRGYLDFYVGSELFLRVYGKENKNICLICCDV